jgi:hypothetical protein
LEEKMPKKKLNKKDTKAIKAGSMFYEKMDTLGNTNSPIVSAYGNKSSISTTRRANPPKRTANQHSKPAPTNGRSSGGAPPRQKTHLHRRHER